MAYKVSIATGYSTMAVRFPTAEQALAEARNQVEHNAKDVAVTITASGEQFTVDQFAQRIAADASLRAQHGKNAKP